MNSAGTPSIILQEASSTWTTCDLGEVRTRDLMEVVRSHVEFNGCSFTGGGDQLVLGYSSTSISDVLFRGAGDDALKVKGGAASIAGTRVEGATSNALVLDEAAQVRIDGGSFQAAKDVLAVSEGATLEAKRTRITSEEAAPVDVEPVHARHGASQVVLTDVTIEAPGPAKIGKGNKVSLNGKAMNETVKP